MSLTSSLDDAFEPHHASSPANRFMASRSGRLREAARKRRLLANLQKMVLTKHQKPRFVLMSYE
ncbi:hypothetical protein [Sinorhizobium meliloti]|nr:hypothetical protein [Sinorhizobium meliloti]